MCFSNDLCIICYICLCLNVVSEVDSVDYGLPGRSDDIDSESDFLVISESEDEKASYQRCNYFDDNENTELEHQGKYPVLI